MSPRRLQEHLDSWRASREGQQAFKDGIDFYDNPYVGTSVARNWENGWKDAEQDALPSD